MNIFLIILFTLIIISSFITYIYITLYNKIKFSKTRIDDAEESIIKELETRYSLIMKTKNVIKKNTKMTMNFYDELEKIKESNPKNQVYEKELSKVVKTIYLIKTDHPKLEEKKEFKDIIRRLEESDTKLDAAKSFYNNNNTELTSLSKKFPSSIICLIHKIKVDDYYEGKEIFNESDDGIKI